MITVTVSIRSGNASSVRFLFLPEVEHPGLQPGGISSIFLFRGLLQKSIPEDIAKVHVE